MLTKQCARCKTIVLFGLTYCEACKPLAEVQAAESKAKRTKLYNKQRNPIHEAFYASKEWKAIRYEKLKTIKYKCEDCVEEKLERPKLAAEVHHIVTLDDAWEKRFDIHNLRGLCTRHHNIRHDRFVSNHVKRRNKNA